MSDQNRKPDSTDSMEQKKKKKQASPQGNTPNKKMSGPNRPST